MAREPQACSQIQAEANDEIGLLQSNQVVPRDVCPRMKTVGRLSNARVHTS